MTGLFALISLTALSRTYFIVRMGHEINKYVVLKNNHVYFVNHEMTNLNIWTAIIRLVDCWIDWIYVEFRGRVNQQIVGIPMRTNRAPLMAHLF